MKAYAITVLIAQLFFVLLIVSGTQGEESHNGCGPHEEWKECGSPCEKTCDNRDALFACITVCVSGCYCRENYTRKSLTENNCIPTNECPGA